MEKAELIYGGKTIGLPVVTGTEGEKAIDISRLRQESGLITLDVGYQNTGSCMSEITFIDGDRGILRYRGIPIEELAERASFSEVAYLLIYGDLPNRAEQAVFSQYLTQNSMIHEEMLRFFDGFPPTAHPMAILATMVNAMSVYYTDYYTEDFQAQTFDLMAASLISRIRTIAAYSYKHSIGQPHIYPKPDLKYTANFLYMMFDSPVDPYVPDPDIEKVLSTLLILHADHEQNCSTSTVRLVGSSMANLYASICSGICALWGPLHGGANQKVIDMLENIDRNGISIEECLASAKDKNSRVRLFGFGHRVYKSHDPRARILKQCAKTIFRNSDRRDSLVNIAIELEEAALKDEFFIERKLYPNIDFYSGILFRMIGIPTNMFTVMFAIGRLPGMIAQWKEMHDATPLKIGRPRQIYTGSTLRHYIPLEERP
ncbi:MAG: citrate synthase [Syntrophales bacterium]|nr:citrate synthase [Syntrophales bacterium]MDD4340155.1 citrate synthase [Syntrophales bacterium]HOG07386.1 citrate synthase [Syntrophales bacterium]HOS76840.1 citrate synthase [Syntrophales bacterium]HPB71022.1 citrate synthase [Syntrophales bacterium]